MIDAMESIIYQTGVKEWKCILFDVSDKTSRRLITEQNFSSRFEAEEFAKESEDKLVCGIDSPDYTL
jgi:hypothetical protein